MKCEKCEACENEIRDLKRKQTRESRESERLIKLAEEKAESWKNLASDYANHLTRMVTAREKEKGKVN